MFREAQAAGARNAAMPGVSARSALRPALARATRRAGAQARTCSARATAMTRARSAGRASCASARTISVTSRSTTGSAAGCMTPEGARRRRATSAASGRAAPHRACQPRPLRHCCARFGCDMAPPALRYARTQARRLVAAPCAVSRDDVRSAPPCGCLGGGRAPPAPPQRVPLSALDTFLFVRLLQIPVAFFYRGRIDAEALATSLGRTLERFPIVAGAQPPPQHAQPMCYTKSRGSDLHLMAPIIAVPATRAAAPGGAWRRGGGWRGGPCRGRRL